MARACRRAVGVACTVSVGVSIGAATAAAQFDDVASDLGDGISAVGADAYDVLTFPKLMDGGDWARFAGVLAVGGLLYSVDDDLYDGLVERQDQGWSEGLRDVGDFFEPVGLMKNTAPFYAGALAVGYVADWKPVQYIGQDLLVSHLLSTLTRIPVRELVGRARPTDGVGAYTYEPGEYKSFPSGHAASIVQVATVVSHHVDAWPVQAAVWGMAGTVLFQRVDAGTHWASDTWIGAAWGWGISKIVLSNADRGRGVVRPMMDGRTGMPGLSVPVGL